MAKSSNTSFIPKRSFARREVRKRSPRMYILTIISMAILFGTVLAASVVFLLHYNADRQLTEREEELRASMGAFSQEDFLYVNEFDNRITYVKDRLEQRLSPYRILGLLEELTLVNVEVTSFDFSADEEDGDATSNSVTINIETEDLNGVQNQRDLLLAHEAVSDVELPTSISYTTETSNEGETLAPEAIQLPISFGLSQAAIAYDPTTYAFQDVSPSLEDNSEMGTEEGAVMSPLPVFDDQVGTSSNNTNI